MWRRRHRYHERCGAVPANCYVSRCCWRVAQQDSQKKIFNGLNFRMSELHGAIMLVQLRRLEGLLTDLRQRKATLKRAIQDVAKRKGVSFRTINDADGDTATS